MIRSPILEICFGILDDCRIGHIPVDWLDGIVFEFAAGIESLLTRTRNSVYLVCRII